MIFNEEKLSFQLLFLKTNDNLSVEVIEVEDIDFREVERRLRRQESVFITQKSGHKLKNTSVAGKDATEPWYINRR